MGADGKGIIKMDLREGERKWIGLIRLMIGTSGGHL
jgi:hypothetical protein